MCAGVSRSPEAAPAAESRSKGHGVERRRGRGLNARDGRRDAPGKVLKDRRSPRQRGRMGTSRVERGAQTRRLFSRARRVAPVRVALSLRLRRETLRLDAPRVNHRDRERAPQREPDRRDDQRGEGHKERDVRGGGPRRRRG
eukprot:31412-Pelagococcus_subviridis.AAC.16